jgi:hypothetical protein
MSKVKITYWAEISPNLVTLFPIRRSKLKMISNVGNLNRRRPMWQLWIFT